MKLRKDNQHHDRGFRRVSPIRRSGPLSVSLAISFIIFFLFGCALKPSNKMGVNRQYVIDSMMVDVRGQLSRVYILDSTSLKDLDSLSSVSYFGSESKYHVFFQWSKVAAPPNDVTLFALDSSFCKLENTFPIAKSDKLKEKTDQYGQNQKTASFKKTKCSLK